MEFYPVAADDTVASSEIKFVHNTVLFEYWRFCVLCPATCVVEMAIFTFYDRDILAIFNRVKADWAIIDVVKKRAFAALWLIF